MSVWGKMLDWFALRRVSEAQRRADRWRAAAAIAKRQLERRIKQLTSLQRRLTSINDTTLEDLEDSKALIERHERVVDTLNAELEVYKEVRVPGLVVANHELREGIKAGTAENIRRQVIVSPNEEEMR